MDGGVSDRDYFERILSERDRAEQEREKRLNERFAAQERALDAALKSVGNAVEKQEIANEKRFESANEWRGQSADRERTQQEQIASFGRTLLPRETFDAFLNGYSEFVRRSESFQSRAFGALLVAAIVIPTISALVTYALTN